MMSLSRSRISRHAVLIEPLGRLGHRQLGGEDARGAGIPRLLDRAGAGAVGAGQAAQQ